MVWIPGFWETDLSRCLHRAPVAGGWMLVAYDTSVGQNWKIVFIIEYTVYFLNSFKKNSPANQIQVTVDSSVFFSKTVTSRHNLL